MSLRLATLLLAAAAAGAAEYPPLEVVETDIIAIAGQQLEGEVVGETDDRVEFQPRGGASIRSFPKVQVRYLQRRTSATAAVSRRGEAAMRAGDLLEAERTARWGTERGAEGAALALARRVLERKPDNTGVAELASDLLLRRGDDAGALELVAGALAASRTWEFGHRTTVMLHEKAGRAAEHAAAVAAWLQVSPTNPDANRRQARISEAAGDLRTARRAYGLAWRFGRDLAAADRYAVLSLRQGERADAVRAATAVIDAASAGATAAPAAGTARGVLGVCRAMDRAGDQAGPLLDAALADAGTDPQVRQWAQHAKAVLIGVADPAAAAALLADLADPMSQLARAMYERRPFTAVASLPSAEAKQLAVQLNVALAVQAGAFPQARALAREATGDNARFLQLATEMLADPNEGRVNALRSFPGEDSVRLQAYGHILAGRWARAEALLGQLRQDDGYAAVYRVYVAAAQKQTEQARQLFQLIAGARNPPPPEAFAARLAVQYDVAEQVIESFDWPAGTRAMGWQVANQGTGITVSTRDGALRFTGVQGNDQPTWVWRMAIADRVKSVEFVPAATPKGRVALVVANEERTQGAVIALERGRAQAAPIAGGRLGPFRDMGEAQAGRLRVAPVGGRLQLIDIANPNLRTPLEGSVAGGVLAIGVLAIAERNQPLDAGADELRILLKPVADQ